MTFDMTIRPRPLDGRLLLRVTSGVFFTRLGEPPADGPTMAEVEPHCHDPTPGRLIIEMSEPDSSCSHTSILPDRIVPTSSGDTIPNSEKLSMLHEFRGHHT